MRQYDKLISSARNLADMITLCERIEWGQDSAKLHQCADAIEALQAENEQLRCAIERAAGLLVVRSRVSLDRSTRNPARDGKAKEPTG